MNKLQSAAFDRDDLAELYAAGVDQDQLDSALFAAWKSRTPLAKVKDALLGVRPIVAGAPEPRRRKYVSPWGP